MMNRAYQTPPVLLSLTLFLLLIFSSVYFVACDSGGDVDVTIDSDRDSANVDVDTNETTDGTAGDVDTTPEKITLLTKDAKTADRPVAPIKVEDSCPFECCEYNDHWKTTAETTVYSEPNPKTAQTFTIPAETTLNAVGGHVMVRQLGRVIARKEMPIYPDNGKTTMVAVGDTLLVLEHLGEGMFRSWYKGAIAHVDGNFLISEGLTAEQKSIATVLDDPIWEWWAEVKLPDGRTGWLWMDQTETVLGADGCG